MKNKLKFLVFLISMIILASFITSCSNEVNNSEYVIGFIINENSLEYGEKVKIFDEKNGKVNIEFEDGNKTKIKTEYVKNFEEMFQQTNDTIFISNDTNLYEGITIQSKTQINIFKGMSLNRIYKGEDYSIIEYDEKEYFIKNEAFSSSITIEEINKTIFIEEEIPLYEYATSKSEVLCNLKELSEVYCIHQFDDYFFVESNGFFGYIKEVEIKEYKDLFETLNEDIFITTEKVLYDEPNLSTLSNITFPKGTKLRVIGKKDNVYVLEYDGKQCYIDNSNTINAGKIFSYVNDKVITLDKTFVYSTMSTDGQKLVMVDKGYTFNRLYIGKNGFDIVKIGDSIGYIESNKLKIYELESKVVEKQMYTIGDCYYYNDKTLTLNKTKITKGTNVVVIEEFKNNISKIRTNNGEGYIESKFLSNPYNTFYDVDKVMYSKYDISLIYNENGEEKTIIVPKGMFVYVKQESLVGLSKIRYNDHEGYVSSSFLDINPPIVEKPKFEIVESIKDPTKDYNQNHKELTEYYLKSYNSKGLEIIIERFYKNGTVYWIADIKTDNPSQQLCCAVSNDKYPGKREKTSSIVKRHNGILGINGSGFFYADNTIFPNVTIKDSQIYKDELGTSRVLCIDDKGNIFACGEGEQAASLLSKGVTNTFGFGPPLIIDGNLVYQNSHDAESGYQPRTAIGMVENGHYIVVVADGRRNYTRGMKISQLASIFKEKRCKYAYNLDGGGSTTLYFNGEVLNNPSDGSERPVVDVIYFK